MAVVFVPMRKCIPLLIGTEPPISVVPCAAVHRPASDQTPTRAPEEPDNVIASPTAASSCPAVSAANGGVLCSASSETLVQPLSTIAAATASASSA